MTGTNEKRIRLEPSRHRFPPPQCVTCSRFVAVHDGGTRRIEERGDFGTVLSVEFECARCATGRKGKSEVSRP